MCVHRRKKGVSLGEPIGVEGFLYGNQHDFYLVSPVGDGTGRETCPAGRKGQEWYHQYFYFQTIF